MNKRKRAPEVRFPEFEDEWEQRKLKDLTERVTGNDGRMDLPTLTISAANGWMDQRDRFSGNIAGKEQKNYTLLSKGMLSYNHGNSKLAAYGTVFVLEDYEEALVPRVYHSFKTNDLADAKYLEILFASKIPDQELRKLITSGARMDGLLNISYDEFENIKIPIPQIEEQLKISNFFRQVDETITLHQRKLDDLKELKSGLLQKMFPHKGEKVPQVRFPGFTGDWEQRKVGDFYDFKNGLNKGKGFFGSGVPIVNFTDVFHNRGIDPENLQGRVNLSPAEIKNFEVQQGDIFFTRTSEIIEEIGYPSVMLGKPENTVFSGFVLRGRAISEDPLTLAFKKYVFYTDQFRNEMVKKSSMTTRALTSGTAIKEMFFSFPKSKEEQDQIGLFFTKIDETITLHQKKIDDLNQLKSGLLQKMFVA